MLHRQPIAFRNTSKELQTVS